LRRICWVGETTSLLPYIGCPFQCACGEIHTFCPAEKHRLPYTPVICLLPNGHLIVQCPVSEAMTCVRPEGTLTLCIRSLFGTTEPPEKLKPAAAPIFPSVFQQVHPSNKKTAPASGRRFGFGMVVRPGGRS